MGYEGRQVSKRSRSSTPGFFGVAVYNPKTEANIGTLWRSATAYQAAVIATVGVQRYVHQASDTCKTPNNLPLLKFSDVDDLFSHLPFGCQLVGVELDDRAESLSGFAHPDRAFYLLGAEDHGLPDVVLDRCHRVVRIPSPVSWSLNVSVAGSLVLHDRFVKRGGE